MGLSKICRLFKRTKASPVVAKTESPPDEPAGQDVHCDTGITLDSIQTVRRTIPYRESWNGEPPEPAPQGSWADAFDINCQHVPPPFERHSAPSGIESQSANSALVVSSQNFVLSAELSRLQDQNDKLAEHLEKTDRALSQTRQALEREQEASRVVQHVLYDRQDEVVQLRRDNQRLRLIAEGLTSNKKDSRKTLKAKLAEAEVRAFRDKVEMARLRAELHNSLRDNKALEEDAWELWDAIIATGAQGGVHSRLPRALSKLSLRFE